MLEKPSSSDFTTRWRERLLEAITAAKMSREAVAIEMGMEKGPFLKRCSGRTGFAVEEFVWLCERFQLPRSPRELERTSLSFVPMRPPDTSFDREHYLAGLEGLRDRFTRQLDPSQTHLYQLASDLPVFWILGLPVIAALKLYLWEWGSRDHAAYRQPFDLDDWLDKLKDWLPRANAISEAYAQIHSDEIWGPSPIEGLLSDIELLAERDAIKPHDLRRVFTAVRKLIENIRLATEEGIKARGGSFTLYRHARHSMSSKGLLINGEDSTLFLTFDVPNHLVSNDRATRDFFVEYFNTIKRSADTIGRGARFTARRLAEEMHNRLETMSRKLLSESQSPESQQTQSV